MYSHGVRWKPFETNNSLQADWKSTKTLQTQTQYTLQYTSFGFINTWFGFNPYMASDYDWTIAYKDTFHGFTSHLASLPDAVRGSRSQAILDPTMDKVGSESLKTWLST